MKYLVECLYIGDSKENDISFFLEQLFIEVTGPIRNASFTENTTFIICEMK